MLPLILIVEDCEEAVPALQIALESAFHCTVEHAPDGTQAMRTLAVSAGPVLAVITDLNLPEMDGWALIAALRATERWARVPILVISADPDPRAPARTRERGANAFFPKPYSPAEVCRSLKEILHANSNLDSSVTRPGGTPRTERE